MFWGHCLCFHPHLHLHLHLPPLRHPQEGHCLSWSGSPAAFPVLVLSQRAAQPHCSTASPVLAPSALVGVGCIQSLRLCPVHAEQTVGVQWLTHVGNDIWIISESTLRAPSLASKIQTGPLGHSLQFLIHLCFLPLWFSTGLGMLGFPVMFPHERKHMLATSPTPVLLSEQFLDTEELFLSWNRQ